MRGFTVLLALLALAACGSYAAAGRSGPPRPRTLVSDTVSLSPGEAVLWGATSSVISSANVRVEAHNAGSAAVDVLLMPLEQWRLWQSCAADAGERMRLEPGATAELAVVGGCRQRWVLSASHAEEPGDWPRPGNASVRLSAEGTRSGYTCNMYRNLCRSSENSTTTYIIRRVLPRI